MIVHGISMVLLTDTLFRNTTTTRTNNTRRTNTMIMVNQLSIMKILWQAAITMPVTEVHTQTRLHTTTVTMVMKTIR